MARRDKVFVLQILALLLALFFTFMAATQFERNRWERRDAEWIESLPDYRATPVAPPAPVSYGT